MRNHFYSRDMLSDLQARGRIASLIDREPVTVNVQRYTTGGNGVTGPKTLSGVVSSFTGRLEESRRSPQLVTNDAMAVSNVQWVLIVLRTNDAIDGVSGNPVDIKTDDRISVYHNATLLGNYIVAQVNSKRSHHEVTLNSRA